MPVVGRGPTTTGRGKKYFTMVPMPVTPNSTRRSFPPSSCHCWEQALDSCLADDSRNQLRRTSRWAGPILRFLSRPERRSRKPFTMAQYRTCLRGDAGYDGQRALSRPAARDEVPTVTPGDQIGKEILVGVVATQQGSIDFGSQASSAGMSGGFLSRVGRTLYPQNYNKKKQVGRGGGS